MTTVYSPLSRKEQYYHLLYLIGMLVLVLVVVGVFFLQDFHSPFAEDTRREVEMLEQQYKFNEQQIKLEPFVVSTFQQLNAKDFTSLNPLEEDDVIHRINQLSTSFALLPIDDFFIL